MEKGQDDDAPATSADLVNEVEIISSMESDISASAKNEEPSLPAEPDVTHEPQRARRSKRVRPAANTSLENVLRRARNRNFENVEDLPPDYQAEIRGIKKARRSRIDHSQKNLLPMISQQITLHCPDLQRLFIEIFEPCNEYAAAMESSARLRITDDKLYKSYMSSFDSVVDALVRSSEALAGKLEEGAKGAMAESPAPRTFTAKIQSPRSKQILDAFQLYDDAARHASFLTIYGHMDKDGYATTISQIRRELSAMARGLQRVKRNCFSQIRSATVRFQRERAEARSKEAEQDRENTPRLTRQRLAAASGRAAGLKLVEDEGDGE